MNLTQRLLLLLARVELDEGDRELARWYAARADWAMLFELADRGSIAGMVARHVEGLGGPGHIGRKFALASLATEQQNRVLVGEAVQLCGEAEARGLTLVPLKGAALNMGLPFTDLSLRRMVDIDLLTSRAELEEVAQLLGQCGYVEWGDRRKYLRYYHHLLFQRTVASTVINLELHWTALHVMYSRPELDDLLLGRTRVERVWETPVRLPSLEDLWFTLALHLVVHRYRGELKWLVDLGECARTQRFAWDTIDETARAAGARGAVAYVGWLTSELLGVSTFLAPRPFRLAILRRASPPEGLLQSEGQPRLAARLIVNLLQYDRPLIALDWSAHKALEIIDRHLGLRLPRPTRRSAAATARS